MHRARFMRVGVGFGCGDTLLWMIRIGKSLPTRLTKWTSDQRAQPLHYQARFLQPNIKFVPFSLLFDSNVIFTRFFCFNKIELINKWIFLFNIKLILFNYYIYIYYKGTLERKKKSEEGARRKPERLYEGEVTTFMVKQWMAQMPYFVQGLCRSCCTEWWKSLVLIPTAVLAW